MPGEAGYTLTHSSAARLAKMLRDWENGRLGFKEGQQGDYESGDGLAGQVFVKVTGTNAAYPAGDYVGELTWFDMSDGQWHSQFDPVRVREINAGSLTTGSRYRGEYVETIAGVDVFSVQASGGGGNGNVNSVQCAGGILMVGYSTPETTP